MRVLVLTGAGISAESGIPTFRGKDGRWRNLDPMKLATSEAFEKNPESVWEWYRERRQRIRSAQPNAAHEAIARLSILSCEFLLVTQNVDDLHARAGVGKEKMVQIHGDIFLTRCSRCDFTHREQEDPPTLHSGAAGEHEKIPKCTKCDALMRPGVVWFGEQLDPAKIDIVESYLARGASIGRSICRAAGEIVGQALRLPGVRFGGRCACLQQRCTVKPSLAGENTRPRSARNRNTTPTRQQTGTH